MLCCAEGQAALAAEVMHVNAESGLPVRMTLKRALRSDLARLRSRRLCAAPPEAAAERAALLPAAPLLPEFFSEQPALLQVATGALKSCSGLAGTLSVEGAQAVDVASRATVALTGADGVHAKGIASHVVLVSSAQPPPDLSLRLYVAAGIALAGWHTQSASCKERATSPACACLFPFCVATSLCPMQVMHAGWHCSAAVMFTCWIPLLLLGAQSMYCSPRVPCPLRTQCSKVNNELLRASQWLRNLCEAWRQAAQIAWGLQSWMLRPAAKAQPSTMRCATRRLQQCAYTLTRCAACRKLVRLTMPGVRCAFVQRLSHQCSNCAWHGAVWPISTPHCPGVHQTPQARFIIATETCMQLQGVQRLHLSSDANKALAQAVRSLQTSPAVFTSPVLCCHLLHMPIVEAGALAATGAGRHMPASTPVDQALAERYSWAEAQQHAVAASLQATDHSMQGRAAAPAVQSRSARAEVGSLLARLVCSAAAAQGAPAAGACRSAAAAFAAHFLTAHTSVRSWQYRNI
jgi:hypothetical protein